MLSLIYEGVFLKFPGLKVVLMESGVSWLPAFMWRANKTWRGVRVEVPWIDREPAAIMRDHIRLTTQPFDAPPDAAGVADIIDMIGSDKMFLFASDYPHWQFDGDAALPEGMSPELVRSEVARGLRVHVVLGDPVAAENYYQHAEHYFRLIAAAQEHLLQNLLRHVRGDRVGRRDVDQERDAALLRQIDEARSELLLKWPNDVLLKGGKVAGMLIEGASEAAPNRCKVVIGTGINLASYPPELEQPATSLAAHGGSATPAAAFESLAAVTDAWLSRWAEGVAFQTVRRAWLDRAGPTGRPLRVRLPEHVEHDGVGLGVGEDPVLLRSRPGGADRVPGLGAAARRSAHRSQVLPQRAIFRGDGHRGDRVRGDGRLLVPQHLVPAGRPGIQPAGGRALPAADGGDDGGLRAAGRADRRRPCGGADLEGTLG